MIREVLGSFTKKPVTITYPALKVQMPDKFRGKIVYHAQRCIGCMLCVRDCPSEAIAINKIGEKRWEAIIKMDRCVYCGQCVDSCNKDALESSKDYELAALDKATLTVDVNIDGPLPQAGPVAGPLADPSAVPVATPPAADPV